MRFSSLRALIVAGALGFGPAIGVQAEDGPSAAIDRFHEVLLGVMKEAKGLEVEARYERLEPAIDGMFAFPLMIRIATGSYWSKGTDAEHEEAIEAFSKMSVATYADRFDGWNGHRFETVGEKPGPQGTTLVETKLHRPNDDPVELVYVMREVEGEWRVVDVLLDGGISELARYRSEYRKILADSGLTGLIAELRSKTSKLLGQDGRETA